MRAVRIALCVAVGFLYASAAGAQPQVAVNGALPPAAVTLTPGAVVAVSVAGGPANTTDWVGLYASSSSDDAYLDWRYLSGSTAPPAAGLASATVNVVLPATLGDYEFRFFANNGWGRLASSGVVHIAASPARLTVNGISTPAIVPAVPGKTVTVSFTDGPGNSTDWIGLYVSGTADSAYLAWDYLNGATSPPQSGLSAATLPFGLPATPGNYEFRAFASNGYIRLAVSPTIAMGPSPARLTVNGVAAPTIVSTVPGKTVTASITDGPGNAADWIGLYAAGTADTEYLTWQYLSGTTAPPESGLSAASLVFGLPVTPGTYEFRAFANNGYTGLTTSPAIEMGPSPARITINGAVTPVTTVPGTITEVAVTDGPGNATDWVGLYAVGAADTQYLGWFYLTGTTAPPAVGLDAGTLHFQTPATPGAYEFRFFANNGSGRLVTSATDTVTPSPARITVNGTAPPTPITLAPGASPTVGITNGPGNTTDWVGLYVAGTPETAYLSWQYLNGSTGAPSPALTSATLTFTIPTTPATYEFRLYANNGYERLATSSTIAFPGSTTDTTLPVITAQVMPAPNAAGWNHSPVTVAFICTDAESGIAACPTPVLVSTDGVGQVISGTATDRAGNSATTSVTLKIDTTMPIVTASVSPEPNSYGWNNTPVTVHFTCSDADSGVTICPSEQTIATEGVNQVASGTAEDGAGNQGSDSVVINIDRTAPMMALTPPSSGTDVFAESLSLSGAVTDPLSGVAGATCNGISAMVDGDRINCAVTLAIGTNDVTVVATDLAGNSGTSTLAVNYVRRPVVTITSPANLGYLNISPTTVSGTVDDPTATVTINSIPAPVASGSFSIALPVAEGPNVITVTATAASGAIGTASLEATLDTTPPHVTITSPPDQFVTSDSSITVAGAVNDIVVGTVNDEQARVTVNGAEAQVSNRTFLTAGVPLQIGPNVIQAVGRDRVGNAATTQITVTRQAPSQPHIQLIAGNNQAGAIGSELAAPLVVAVTDAAGAPVANAPIIFKVTQNDGLVAAADALPAANATIATDAEGHAQARWTLGNRSGAGGNILEAYSVGYQGTAIFTATGTQGSPTRIVVDAGNDQLGAIGQPLAKPFIAVVVDEGHNRLAGVPVTFTVDLGGGSFDGQATTTAISDSDGRVAATLTLGLQEGNANNLVEATFQGNTASSAAFLASGRAPGNPADTVVSGVVLDNSNIPIPGVIVRAVLTNELHSNASSVQSAIIAQTNQQGQFRIPQAPVGLVKILVDGSTAPPVGTYPALEYDIVTVAGQDNTVGQPIYLVALNPANQLCVTATTGGGTLTMGDAPGFSLTFAPGQVTFPGGAKDGCVGVTVVHADKVPMAPSFGEQPQFIVTIQPAGAIFNPPAAVTFPNVAGLSPRTVTELFSYDHDIGAFVSIGTGVVSDDSFVVRSSPGVGVLKAGWHGAPSAGPPNVTGTAATCDFCQMVVSNQCGIDPRKVGRPCPDEGDPRCSIDTCGGGRCLHVFVDPVAPYSPDPYPTDTGNLTQATRDAVACTNTAAAAVGGFFRVTFGYRPQSYQDHILSVYDRYQLIVNWTETECDATKTNILAEWAVHSPFDHRPAVHSNHTSGTAFDAQWSLPAETSIDTVAQSCSLSRCVSNDLHHFCR